MSDQSRNPGDFRWGLARRRSVPVEVMEAISEGAGRPPTGPFSHGDLTPPSLPYLLAVITDNSSAPWYSWQEILQADFATETPLVNAPGLLSGVDNLWEINQNANVPIGAFAIIYSGTGDHGEDWFFNYVPTGGSGSGSGGLCGGAALFVDQELRCSGGKLQIRFRNDNVALLPTGCLTQTVSDWGPWQDLDCKTSCPPASFTQEVARCEALVSTGPGGLGGLTQLGVSQLNIYAQTVTLSYNANGCPQFTKGGTLTLLRAEGCCTCPPPGQIFCICPGPTTGQSGSSGGSSGSQVCIPGTCSLCKDPPYAFYLELQGFSGLCDVFNGNWWIVNTGPCIWSFTIVHINLPVTVTLELTGFTWFLTLSFGLPGDELAQVVYEVSVNPTTPIDCCQTLNLTLSKCNCGGGSGSGGSGGSSGGGGGCPCCSSSGGSILFPSSWGILGGGFTGDFAWIGAISELFLQAGCTWSAFGKTEVGGFTHTVEGILSLGCAGNPSDPTPGWTLELRDLDNGASIGYNLGGTAPFDCCSSITLLQEGLVVGTGGFPSTLNLSPIGCGGPPPPAPDTAGGCGGCTGSTPATWTVGIDGATGCWAPMNGSWSVSADGACAWQSTYPVTGGTLTVNVSISGTVPPFLLEVVVQYVDSAGTAQCSYTVFNFDGDCCIATTAGLGGPPFCSRGGGGAPALTVSLTPSCTDTSPTPCPPTIAAEPLCCGGTGSGSGSGGETGAVATDCCVGGLPPILFANFHNGTGDCTCLNGLSVPLTYDVPTARWLAPSGFSYGCATGHGVGPNTLFFLCEDRGGGSFQYTISGLGDCSFGGNNLVDNLDPCSNPVTIFSDVTVDFCCTGTIQITVEY